MENDARRAAVAVEGHHAGALASVGRGYPGTHQRVEQRGLAGLDPADDRHPQWLVQPLPPVPQPCRCHRLLPVGLPGPVEEPPGPPPHPPPPAPRPPPGPPRALAPGMGGAGTPAPAPPPPATP